MSEVYNQPHIHQRIDENYSLNISGYYSQAWNIVKSNLGLFMGYTIVVMLMGIVVNLVPIIGSLAFAVVSPALIMGFYVVANKITNGETVTFSNFFDGLPRLGELFLVNLCMGLLILLGFLLLIIPGIYLAIAYCMALPLTFFQYNGSVGDTLKTSRVVVSKQWFSFFGFYILAFFVALLGVLCLGVGIFVAVPVVYVAHFLMFKDIFGKDDSVKDDPFDHLVNNE